MMRILMTAMMVAAMAYGADDPAVKAFITRVEGYAKILKTASDSAPVLPKEAKPAEIEQHEKVLVEAIRAARTTAKQGDMFTPDVRPIFLGILKEHFMGSSKQKSRAIAKQGNPKTDSQPGEAQPVVQVNAAYPKSAPLSTVPPKLLMQLPALPEHIEYRFVGTTLILWDNISNLIIDYMREAAPGL